MHTPEEQVLIAKYRQVYEAGKQEHDAEGTPLWYIVRVTIYHPTPEDPVPMWMCETAEGPKIWAERRDGVSRLQVDGRPERRDIVAERFVAKMETSYPLPRESVYTLRLLEACLSGYHPTLPSVVPG